jgi:1,2-phenylacetyl-CoA epoxidase PaaB subunit
MWLVPSNAISSYTNQEAYQLVMEENLSPGSPPLETTLGDTTEVFYIFCKNKPSGPQRLLGSLIANNAQDAIRSAIRSFALDGQPYSWWVIPARSICQVDPQEIEDLFEPTQNRPFRMSTDFHTVSAMRQIKDG